VLALAGVVLDVDRRNPGGLEGRDSIIERLGVRDDLAVPTTRGRRPGRAKRLAAVA
jgi:hypothetical protein